MKKIKTAARDYTNTQKPAADYVIRLERSGDALVIRYFKVLPQDEVANETIELELPAFDPTSTALMRLLVQERIFINPAAVTSAPEVASGALREIGRHIFRPTIGDSSVVGAGEKTDLPLFIMPFGSDGNVAEPYNHLVESSVVKSEVQRSARLRAAQPIFVLHATKPNAPLQDWTCVYVDSAPFILEDTTAGAWEPAQAGFTVMKLLPKIELAHQSSIAAGGMATVSVTMKRDGEVLTYTGELVVQALSGYLPKSRIQVTNGTATFNVMALGLEAGDSVRIKIGTKNVSGLAEATLTVT